MLKHERSAELRCASKRTRHRARNSTSRQCKMSNEQHKPVVLAMLVSSLLVVSARRVCASCQHVVFARQYLHVSIRSTSSLPTRREVHRTLMSLRPKTAAATDPRTRIRTEESRVASASIPRCAHRSRCAITDNRDAMRPFHVFGGTHDVNKSFAVLRTWAAR